MKTPHSLERIFRYKGRPLRILQPEDGPWFVAADACSVLGLSQVSRAVRRLDGDTVRLLKVTHPQQPHRTVLMNAVNESGLYQLILTSHKPAAQSFRRWVTHEVIPALRQTGRYSMEPVAEKLPLPRFSRRDLLNLALAAEDECDGLKQENEALRPKAEAYERIAAAPDSFSLGETAKLLGIPHHGRNNLIRFLRQDGVLMQNNVALQRYIERGYFCLVEQDYFSPDGEPHVRLVTRVYPSGVEFIRQRIEGYVRRQLSKPGPQRI